MQVVMSPRTYPQTSWEEGNRESGGSSSRVQYIHNLSTHVFRVALFCKMKTRRPTTFTNDHECHWAIP